MAQTKQNTRLTQYDDLKEIVIASAIKNVPELKKKKESAENKTLSQFT